MTTLPPPSWKTSACVQSRYSSVLSLALTARCAFRAEGLGGGIFFACTRVAPLQANRNVVPCTSENASNGFRLIAGFNLGLMTSSKRINQPTTTGSYSSLLESDYRPASPEGQDTRQGDRRPSAVLAEHIGNREECRQRQSHESLSLTATRAIRDDRVDRRALRPVSQAQSNFRDDCCCLFLSSAWRNKTQVTEKDYGIWMKLNVVTQNKTRLNVNVASPTTEVAHVTASCRLKLSAALTFCGLLRQQTHRLFLCTGPDSVLGDTSPKAIHQRDTR